MKNLMMALVTSASTTAFAASNNLQSGSVIACDDAKTRQNWMLTIVDVGDQETAAVVSLNGSAIARLKGDLRTSDRSLALVFNVAGNQIGFEFQGYDVKKATLHAPGESRAVKCRQVR